MTDSTWSGRSASRSRSIPNGGISTVEDAVEYLIAGASAIQVGTATFVNPTAMLGIIDGLAAWLEAEGLSSVRQLIGTVVDDEQAENVVFMEAAP